MQHHCGKCIVAFMEIIKYITSLPDLPDNPCRFNNSNIRNHFRRYQENKAGELIDAQPLRPMRGLHCVEVVIT
jgi:hypothetical protein